MQLMYQANRMLRRSILAALLAVGICNLSSAQSIQRDDRVGVNHDGHGASLRNDSCQRIGSIPAGDEGVADRRYECRNATPPSYGWYLLCQNGWVAEQFLVPLPGRNCYPNVSSEFQPGSRHAYKVEVYRDVEPVRLAVRTRPNTDCAERTSRSVGAIGYTRIVYGPPQSGNLVWWYCLWDLDNITGWSADSKLYDGVYLRKVSVVPVYTLTVKAQLVSGRPLSNVNISVSPPDLDTPPSNCNTCHGRCSDACEIERGTSFTLYYPDRSAHVFLTAPPTITENGQTYTFVRWETTDNNFTTRSIAIDTDRDKTATAVYAPPPDTQPPSISNPSITPNPAPCSGGSVSICATVTDNQSGVASVWAEVCGTRVDMTHQGNNRYCGTYNAPSNCNRQDRTCPVTIYARDNAGNQASISAGTLTIRGDTSGPTVRCCVEPTTLLAQGGVVSIFANVSDDCCTLSSVSAEIYRDGSLQATINLSPSSGSNCGSYNYRGNYDVPVNSSTQSVNWRVKVVATDSAGNQSSPCDSDFTQRGREQQRGCLSISGQDLNASGTQGGPFSPSSTTYTLSNTGEQSISWSASASCNWLTISPSSGTLSGGQTVTVTVSLNSQANNLTPGNYTCAIDFTNTTNGCGNTQRSASLNVQQRPQEGCLVVSPSDGLDAQGPQGGPFSPSSKQYILSNSGGQSINWSASVNCNWVSVSLTAGTLSPGQTATVTVSLNDNANRLNTGTHSCTVSFTNTTNGCGNQEREIRLTVQSLSAGCLYVAPSSGFIASGPQGGPFDPTSKDYTLRNTGQQPLEWQVRLSQTADWLTIEPASGTLASGAQTTVRVSINANARNLYPNLYQVDCEFVNLTNGCGNQTRRITLEVREPTEEFPDLVPLNVQVTPNPSKIGQTVTIRFRVHNQGNRQSSECKAKVYWERGPSRISWNVTIPAILPGQSVELTSTYIPRNHGTYQVRIQVDWDRRSGQSDQQRENDWTEPVRVDVSSSFDLRLPIGLPSGSRGSLNFLARTYQGTPAPPYGHGGSCDEMRRVADLYPLRQPSCPNLSLCRETPEWGFRRSYLVVAAHSGKVSITGWRDDGCVDYRNGCNPEKGRYRSVTVTNEDLGIKTLYVHLRVDERLRNEQEVRAGDVLGTVDDYGCARTGPHLHFAVIRIRDGQVLPLDDGTVTFNGLRLLAGDTPCGEPQCNGYLGYVHSLAPPGGDPSDANLFLDITTRSVDRGGVVQAAGVLSPAEAGRRIVIVVSSPNPEEGILTYETQTDASGGYAVTIPVPREAYPGTWTVVAYAPEQTGYDDLTSEPVEFEVVNASPDTPTQISPAVGEITSSLPVLVLSSADPESDQIRFRVELSRVNISSISIETDLVQSGNRVEIVPPTGLSAGSWRWRAKAIDRFGAESEWSEWRDFVVLEAIPTKLVGTGTFGFSMQTNRSTIQDIFIGTIRFKQWNPSSSVYEEVSTLSPGTAYWFYAPAEVMARLSGSPIAPTTPIPLVRGWNLIPAYATLRWNLQTIQVRRGGETKTLAEARQAGWVEDYAWAWEPDGANPLNGRYRLVYDASMVPGALGSIEAWRGYWIYAYADCELILTDASRAPNRGVASASSRGWGLRLIASTQGGSSEVLLGVSNNKRSLSVGLPPDPPETAAPVRLSIKQGDVRLGADIRRRERQTESWELEVELAPSATEREVTIYWPNITALPRYVNLVLVDMQTGRQRYLRTTSSYTFRVGGSGGRYRFRIETAPLARLLRITNLRATQARGGHYTFSFNLTSSAEITVKVQAANGQVIRTVASQAARNAGTQSVIWDGRDQQGVALPPGQYLITVEAVTEDGQVARAAVPVILRR